VEDPENSPPVYENPYKDLKYDSHQHRSHWYDSLRISDHEHTERKALLCYVFALLLILLADLLYNEPLYALTL
jgi:hypothetical protein